MGRRERDFGFSLIEVLVGVIGLLAAIVLPITARAKELGRRAVCSSNVHQFVVGLHSYASENSGRLVSGFSDHGEDEHIPILARATHDVLVGYVGDKDVLLCPRLGDPFTNPDSWYYTEHGDYGILIGYNYLGGHGGTPWDITGGPAEAEWVSPQLTTEGGHTPLVTELNAWTTSKNVTFAAHGRRGPILDYNNPIAGGGVPSAEVGAEGGHVGRLDGSTVWKNIDDMKIYRGSRKHGASGFYGCW